MDKRLICPGDIVSGLKSNELVQVQRISPFGKKTLVETYDVIDNWQEGIPLINLIGKVIDTENPHDTADQTEDVNHVPSRRVVL